MHAEIKGTTIPTLEVWLQQDEYVVTQHGELAWMTTSIGLTRVTAAGRPSRRKRAASAVGAALTRYEGPGSVTFAARGPGQIYPVEISPGLSYLVHPRGWLCGTGGIAASAGLRQIQRAGAARGDPVVLCKLEGEGRAWIELGGEVTSYELPPGHTILANPCHVGMFESAVQFSVSRIRAGANANSGGDGPHLLELTGPGRVWLQSMPVPLLAHAPLPFGGQPFGMQHEAGAGNRAAAPRRVGG